MARPIQAIINLNTVVANNQLIKSIYPTANILACVKANAYGHGACKVATSLQDYVDAFGVCSIEEATELRTDLPTKPIVLLEGCFSKEEIPIAVAQDLDIILTRMEQFAYLQEYLAKNIAVKLNRIWIKINTGMNRLGITGSQAKPIIKFCTDNTQINQTIVMTHLHSADSDIASSLQQINLLKQIVANCNTNLNQAKTALQLSWCNSASILTPSLLGGDWLRPGIMLYGANPIKANNNGNKLQPVMSLMADLIDVYTVEAGSKVGYGATWQATKTTKIGVVACGYGDGYPASKRNKNINVFINGSSCPLIGRVSMDMLTVDLTAVPNAKIGNKVELWGNNIDINNVAEAVGTISYDLLTGVSARVPRVYC